jgi:hypothetical protein
MQSQMQLDPIRLFLIRYQSALVIMMGFACAFLLGLLLWNVAAAAVPGVAPLHFEGAMEAPAGLSSEPAAQPEISGAGNDESAAGQQILGGISPVFTAEVRYWEPQIVRWAAEHDLDPNLVATVMQIESCGHPLAISRAGARGLFQVMPFHFAAGEEMLDPETNAKRGVGFLAEVLTRMSGDVGLALAAYNGGPAAAARGWDGWPAETQRYYRWGTGILGDIASGLAESPTLQQWLAAGGHSLCRQAAGELGLP